MKKLFITILLVALISLFAFSTINAASKFSDVTGTKYEQSVDKLVSLNIVSGFPDGSFKPLENVTRAQMAKMIVESLHLKNSTEVALYQFPDVTQAHWGYSWIKTAVDNGVIVGYPDGTFGPDRDVTYAETMTMILRAMGEEKKMTDKTWPTAYVNTANNLGLLSGLDYASVNNKSNRGDVTIQLYNMLVKQEKEQQEKEYQQKIEEQKKAEEAKANALTYGIVASATESKDDYIIKFENDKAKYTLAALEGKAPSKLTLTKVEAIEDMIAAYKEGDKGIDIKKVYTPSDIDSAKIISTVYTDEINFKDKDTWNLKNSTTISTYKYYTFVRVTCSYDEDDGEISFDKISNLGMGLSSVTFAKAERILVDSTRNTVLIFKGFEINDKIKKGVVTDSSDTSDIDNYLYGMVTEVTTKGTTDYAKINKKQYEVSSKSNLFTEDKYAVYTKDDDVIKLVKDYGVADLDSSVSVVKKVSSKKVGSQEVMLNSDDEYTDFYSTTNAKKYEDYHVISIEVEENNKGKLEVVDYDDDYDGLDEILFKVGDRIRIDSKTEVFIIFTGLSASDKYSKGAIVTSTTKAPTATPKPSTTAPTTAPTATPTSSTASPTTAPTASTTAPTATPTASTTAPTATPAASTVAPTATPTPSTAAPTATPTPSTASPTATPEPTTTSAPEPTDGSEDLF